MKKNTRSTSGNASDNQSRTRHSKSTAKPVTIDLEAETVGKKSTTEAGETANQADKRSSVPGTRPVSRSSLSADETAAKTQFGRKNPANDAENPASNAASVKQEESKPVQETAKKAETEIPKGAPARPAPSGQTGPSTSPSSGSGLGGRIAAGVVGGVIALGGAYLLQTSGLIPSPGQNYVSSDALTSTKDELESTLAGLKTLVEQNAAALASKTDSSEVDRRIAAGVKDVSDALTNAAVSDLNDIATQVNETTKRVEDLQRQANQAGNEIAALSQTINGNGAGSDNPSISSRIEATAQQMESLSAEITTLKAGAFDLANRPEPKPSDTPETLAAIAGLQAALPELRSTMTAKIGELTPRITAVERSAAPVASLIDEVALLKSGLAAVQTKTAEGESTIAALRDQSRKIEEKSQLVDQKASRAVAAAALKAQIDRGEPYGEALTNLQAVADPATDLSGLHSFASTGVPTVSQLSGQFASVSKAILNAVAPPQPQDITSRLLSGARSFIKVEPLAPQSGDSPEALVQSISADLAADKLQEASAAWQKLPEPARKASSSWHDGLQARITANSIVSKMVESLLLTSAGQ